MQSFSPRNLEDKPKKSRPHHPDSRRSSAEKFGLQAGELSRLSGNAARSNAVFAAREKLVDLYPDKFRTSDGAPDEGAIVQYLTTVGPEDPICQHYRALLTANGWK